MSWHWKGDEDWTAYSESDSTKIEKAYQKKQKSVKLNENYKIDFKEMIQHRIDDFNRQRQIKREAPEKEEKPKKRGKEQVEEEEETSKKKTKGESKPENPKRLIHDFKLMKEAQTKGEIGASAELIDDDLYRWEVKLFEFDPESTLAKDLAQYNNKHGINYLTLRFYFPPDYPITAPLVHIVTPKLIGGYVHNGGLCMSILMQGWAPGISPESLILQIRQLFMEGNARISNVNKIECFTEKEARDGFAMVAAAHSKDKSFE